MKLQRGFDFLGYRLTTTGLELARESVRRFSQRVSRLYEQGADPGRVAYTGTILGLALSAYHYG